jgi:hypothetical protein
VLLRAGQVASVNSRRAPLVPWARERRLGAALLVLFIVRRLGPCDDPRLLRLRFLDARHLFDVDLTAGNWILAVGKMLFQAIREASALGDPT